MGSANAKVDTMVRVGAAKAVPRPWWAVSCVVHQLTVPNATRISRLTLLMAAHVTMAIICRHLRVCFVNNPYLAVHNAHLQLPVLSAPLALLYRLAGVSVPRPINTTIALSPNVQIVQQHVRHAIMPRPA